MLCIIITMVIIIFVVIATRMIVLSLLKNDRYRLITLVEFSILIDLFIKSTKRLTVTLIFILSCT